MSELQWVLVFFIVGFMVGFAVRGWFNSRSRYSGVIFVEKSEGKTVYSLVLDDYPEKLEFKKQVVLRVETPDEVRE